MAQVSLVPKCIIDSQRSLEHARMSV